MVCARGILIPSGKVQIFHKMSLMFGVSEKYFDMNRKQCKQALGLYKRFIVRMDGVSKFLKVAEVKGSSQAVVLDRCCPRLLCRILLFVLLLCVY